MGTQLDAKAMEKRQRFIARILCAVMAVLVAMACGLLYTGVGSGMLATNNPQENAPSASANKPFYVLLIGSDSRKGTALYTGDKADHAQVDQHADVITLLRVDPQKYRLTLVTVPSNTVLKGQKSPLADTLLGNDPAKTVKAVEKLTGVDVSYYMMVNFNGFESIVGQLETVTVDVDVSVKSQDPISAKNVTVKAGSNRELLPSGALAFARAWDEYLVKQDAHRQANVRKLERAMVKKVLGMDQGAAAMATEVLVNNVKTDMGSALVESLVKKFVKKGPQKVRIYECTGPDKLVSKRVNLVKEDARGWKRLMYVVDNGYNPALSYETVKQKEAERAAEAEQAAQQQAGQYSYENDTGYGQGGQ